MNGGWGEWSGFGECTQSCGGGVRTRSRNCDSPAKSESGLATHDTLSPTQSAPSNRGCSRGSSPRDQSTCLGARWKRRHLQSRLLFAGI